LIAVALSLLAGELVSGWLPGSSPIALALALGCAIARIACRRTFAAATLGRLAAAWLGLWLATPSTTPPDCFVPGDEGATKLWIEAELVDAPSFVEGGIRVPVRASVADRGSICGTVLLTISEPPAGLSAGERVRTHASLRRPRNFGNPRAYDYRGTLARRGVWVTAHAGGPELERLGMGTSGLAPLALQRQRIGALIDRSLPPLHASLLRSLVVGDQASVSPELWDCIAAAGLAHLLSVSGLHIALVWGVVFSLARWILARSERLLLCTDVRALAAAIALPPAIGYAALAGLSVPAARSVGMTALFVLSLSVGREAAPLRVLCLTAGAVGIAWPGAPLEVSFQLSFASVLALVLAGERWSRWRAARVATDRRERILQRAILLFLVPGAALVGTAPLVALYFNRVTPVGLLTNPVLVPVSGTPATVIGLAGAAVSWLSEPIACRTFALAYWPLELLRGGAVAAASFPFASIRVPTPTLIELALSYGFLAVAWIPPGRRGRVGVALLLALSVDGAWWAHERWWHQDLRVRFVDVGQGDAAVLELPGGAAAVIDGGGFGRSRFDVGERVLAPYLWSRKILRVDYLVATHGDWDHQGGLHFLARELAPRELWISGRSEERRRLTALAREVETAGGTVRTLQPGERVVDAHGARIDCLHPPVEEALSANDSSLVLRLRFGERAWLFTGDVESAGEALVASRFPSLPVDVLKVPHHGSATSSTDALLRWATPRLAVMSLGAGNNYGFPNPAVVQRYQRLGIRTLRTDRDGSVGIQSDGSSLVVRPAADDWPLLCATLGALC